jgi:hypothetical protein
MPRVEAGSSPPRPDILTMCRMTVRGAVVFDELQTELVDDGIGKYFIDK